MRTTIERIAAGLFAIVPFLGALGAAEGQGEPDYYTWGLTACLRNGAPQCTIEEGHITVTNSDSENHYLVYAKANARLCAYRAASTTSPAMCHPAGKHTEFGVAEALECREPCGDCVQTNQNPAEWSCGCDCSIEAEITVGPQTNQVLQRQQCNRAGHGCSNSCENVDCNQDSFCFELVGVTLELRGMCSDNCPQMTVFDPPVPINICGAPQSFSAYVPCAQETCCTPGSIPD